MISRIWTRLSYNLAEFWSFFWRVYRRSYSLQNNSLIEALSITAYNINSTIFFWIFALILRRKQFHIMFMGDLKLAWRSPTKECICTKYPIEIVFKCNQNKIILAFAYTTLTYLDLNKVATSADRWVHGSFKSR